MRDLEKGRIGGQTKKNKGEFREDVFLLKYSQQKGERHPRGSRLEKVKGVKRIWQ